MDVLAYTLPTMQLVCHLVTLSNVTNSAVNVQSSPQPQPMSLPDGYIVFPDTKKVAFKLYNQSATVLEARNRCGKEGAHLATIDSLRMVEFVKEHLQPFGGHIHTGIIRLSGTWVNVNTGMPVSSIPWRSGEPSSNADCTLLFHEYQGIGDYSCMEKKSYACALPIPSHDTMVVN